MAEPMDLSREELKQAQIMGATAYMMAYVRLMAIEMSVEVTSEDIRGMILEMVDPLNHATEAIWRALMKDYDGSNEAVDRFKESLDKMTEE
jgi:hypothetical protein